MNAEEVDVAVVGGGPGGATLAALLARRGHRVVVLEKERFPRYQIGESLLPSTVHGVCRLSGAADGLAAAGFVRKNGGTFRWGATPEPWTFSFSISRKLASSSGFAYQVERSRFDEILLRNASRQGAQVREECTVTEIVVDDERVRGLRYVDADGVGHRIDATYVVDASGNLSRLHKHVGARRYSEFFRSVALFGYFEGGKRLPAPNSGNIFSVAFDNGWFWYIPLRDTLTSVGVVVRRDQADRIQGDPEHALAALIAECPLISEYLQDATRVTEGTYGKLRVRKDYSYHTTKFWRPGMALIGDAACFVDPVFSSGVHLATYSALLAARSINSVLAGEVDEERAFREFELRYRREYGTFYEFLMSFYDMHVSADSYFWSAKKVTQNTISELESFVELVGGLASGETALRTPDDLVLRRKKQSKEFSDAVDAVAADQEQSMLPLFKSSVVQEAMSQASQVQSLAALGENLDDETPMFASGLIPSADGMHWVEPATPGIR